MNLAMPEKRDVILYTRVTQENKRFLEDLAEKEEVSQAALIEHIINCYKNASNKRKPR